MRWIGPLEGTRSSSTSRCRLRRDSVVWSGASRSTSIKERTDRKKPSAWRKGNRKTSRSVNAVSIARSEKRCCPPGWRRPPSGLRLGGDPQRHVASLHQRSLVRRPIPNPISRLVLRMNPRLHGEIVRRGPSTRPADRRLPTGARLRSRAPTPVTGASAESQTRPAPT